MTLIYLVDIIGTLAFATSGALIASKNNLDIFGAAVIAFVTALGGGTLRDLLLDIHPLAWMTDLSYILVVLVAVGITHLFKPVVLTLKRTMFMFDSIGIGLFTVIGIQKTLELGMSPLIAVFMGTISAVFGGVLRDVLTNEVPLIFRKEIYATACISGGLIFLTLKYFQANTNIAIIITVIFITSLRIIAVKRKWSLPNIA